MRLETQKASCVYFNIVQKKHCASFAVFNLIQRTYCPYFVMLRLKKTEWPEANPNQGSQKRTSITILAMSSRKMSYQI